jgi:hypothetical protein
MKGIKMKNLSKLMILIGIILFMFVSLNVKSEDLNKIVIKDNLPKLSVGDGFNFYLTFHPCFMNKTDFGNSVSIFILPAASGKATLSIYGLNISRTINLITDSLAEIKLTPEEAFSYLREPTDEVLPEYIFLGKAIQLRTDVPVSCYGVVKFKDRTEGFNVLSESSLGRNYQIATYYNPEQPSYASIVGVYDNTKVTFRLGGCEESIIVRENGDTILFGGVIRRTVNEGDVWLIPGFGPCNDLSGSVITSTKPCAVITGNYSSGIPDNSTAKNYLIEQEIPTNVWGTRYYVSPIITKNNFPIVKIFAKKQYTQVYVDSIPIWKINSAGGKYGSGFIEIRTGAGKAPRPVVISSDSDFPINVVQLNPDDDNTDMRIPFKMQLTPVEQFTNEVVFATPNFGEYNEFTDNYINIVYKAIQDGGIPNDMQIAEVKNGHYNWIPIYVYSKEPGTEFANDKPDENGKIHFSKTLRLPSDGVYMLKANDPFAVTMYGIGKNGAYGFAVSNNYYDLEFPDTLAPFVEVSLCCCGSANGKVIDEPRTDPEIRSNLGLIYMDLNDSYNYTFNVEPFIVGEDASTTWSLIVKDETKNARAHLVFQDKAGNRRDTIIEHITCLPKILETKKDFGTYNSIEPPTIKIMTFTLKNFSGQEIDSNKFRIYLVLDSKINDYKPNEINSYQNFDLVDLDGINLAPIKTDGVIHFKVKFTGDKFGYFKDSIGVVVIQQSTGDTCSLRYFTEIAALMAQAYIIADDFDFDKQENHTRTNTVTLKISNPKTDKYLSVLPLSITGFEFKGDKIEIPGSGAIFELDGLQSISEANPLIIDPGKDYKFNVSFRPDSARTYQSKITFLAKAGDGTDYVLMPDNETILKGIGEPPSSVKENEIASNFVRISPNPANDYIAIQNSEGFAIQIFNIFGEIVFSIEQKSPSFQKIDISNLASGIYFIKVGNSIEKFVKL